MQRLVRQLAPPAGTSGRALVETPGSFSQRGGIVDIFPPPSRRGPGAPGVLRRRGGEHPGVRSGDAALHRDARPLPAAPATSRPCGTAPPRRPCARALDWSDAPRRCGEEWDWQVRDLEAGPSSPRPLLRPLPPPHQGGVAAGLPPRSDRPPRRRHARGAGGPWRSWTASPVKLRQKLTASGAVPAGFRAPAFGAGALPERLSRDPVVHLSYRPAVVGAPRDELSGERRALPSGGMPACEGRGCPFDFASFEMAPHLRWPRQGRDRHLPRGLHSASEPSSSPQQAGRLTELVRRPGGPHSPPTGPGARLTSTIILVHGQL